MRGGGGRAQADVCYEPVVVLSLLPYGESDLVVRLFSPTRGRIGGFARGGARRASRRFAGSLFPLARGVAGLRPRRGELYGLESLEAEASLMGLARDAEAFGRASYCAELVERLVPLDLPEPALYARLSKSIDLFASGQGRVELLRAFELHLLADSGHLPDFEEASDAPGRPPCALDLASGALVAELEPGCVPFGEDVRAACVRLLQAPLDALPALSPELLRAVSRLFAAYLRRAGGPPLRSVQFLRSLRDPLAPRA